MDVKFGNLLVTFLHFSPKIEAWRKSAEGGTHSAQNAFLYGFWFITLAKTTIYGL